MKKQPINNHVRQSVSSKETINIVSVSLDRDAKHIAEAIITLLEKKIMVKVECQGGYYYITSKPFAVWVSGDVITLNYGEVVVTIDVKNKTITEEFKS